MTIGTRIKKAREAKGWSQQDLANAMEMPVTSLATVEQNKNKRRPSWLPDAARALGVPLSQLDPTVSNLVTNVQSEQFKSEQALTKLSRPIISVPVRGTVAAGVWMEDGVLDISGYDPVTIYPSAFAHLDHVAFRVSGNSMDLAGIVDGSTVISVPYFEARSVLQDADIVIVERRRAGLIERTVKRLRQTDAGWELRPESTDLRHKVIELPTGDHETDGIEVEIVGLVWSVQRQLA